MLQQGFVQKILTRPYNGKTMYSVALVNQEGLFGFGQFQPKAGVGDKVEFEATVNEKGYWQAKGGSLKVVAKATEGTSQGSTVAQTGKSQWEKDYWTSRNARDVRNDELRELGASRNTAIAWIELLIKAEAVKLPAKQADKEAAMNALLEDTVNKLRGTKAETKVEVKEAPATSSKSETSEEDVPWT